MINKSFARMIKRIDALPPEKEVRSFDELMAWLDEETAATKEPPSPYKNRTSRRHRFKTIAA